MWDSGSSTRFAFQGVTVVQEPVLLGYRDQASKIALYRQTERPVSPKPSVFARVWVKEAKDLMASDVSVMTGVRSSDPLCRVTLTPNGMPKSTGNYIGCLSADWNTFLTVESAPLHWNDSVDDINLELCVMDKDLLTGDDPLGVINIPVMEKYFEEKAKRIQSGQTSRYRDDESWLLVRVLRASNLPATDFEEVENEETGEIEIERSSDPYVKLECNGQLWGTAPVEGTINPNFLANGEEPFWFRVYNENNIMERFEKEWGEVVEKLPVKVIGYKGSVNMNELAGTKESKEGREGKSGEGKSGEGSKFGKETKIGESKLDESKVQGVQKILTVAEEKELENKRLRQQARQEMVMKNVESIKVVMLEYYQLLCDGFNFYSTWDDVCEEARIKEEERSERHKRREIRKRRREKKEAERRALVKAAMAEKNEKLKKAREWMNSSLRKEQEGIQLRIAEKFHMLINERNQSIRDIFVAFDEDGGGTIDPEELRDGFDALDVELSDYEFERMWEVWDEDGGGEIDFDEFTEMFNKTLVVLEAKLELEKEEKLKEARKWMGDSMRTEQKRIQLRIAEKFRMLRHERNQTVEQIFTAFDEDGGGTIDPEEMREGFDALGVMLTDVEFEKMWEIWDESGDGEVDFEEFSELFERTLLVLEATRLDGEKIKKEQSENAAAMAGKEGVDGEDDDFDDGEESDDPIEDEAEMWAARRTSPPTCMDEDDETISPREYAFFCRQTGILDNKKIKIRTIQEIFRLVNSEVEDDGGSGSGQFRNRGDAEFDRAEFLASLVHVALKRFPEPIPPKPPTPPPAVVDAGEESSELDSDWYSDNSDAPESSSSEEEEEEVWRPGDSLRRLIEELVKPSMCHKFQDDDLTNRSQAYRGDGAGSCLRLSVWDHDVIGDDDFLGETYIDLKDIELAVLDYPATEAGEEAAKNFKNRLTNGVTKVLKGRPGVNADRVMVSGDLTVSVIRVSGRDLSEWDQGRERIEIGGIHKLEFHPEMAEEDHDPNDMTGTLEFRAVIEIPRSLIRRRNNKKMKELKKMEEAEERRKKLGMQATTETSLTLNIHACDSWCTKTFTVKLPDGKIKPKQSKKGQPGGDSTPTEYTFRWLALVAGRRYHQTFRPNGRVRNRESAYGGTDGQITPQGVYAQMPEGFDRLDEKTNLVMHVDGHTPLRKVLRDGDDVWVMFQNRKPSRMIAAGGAFDQITGKRIKPNLKTLQREQYDIDQARAWLKRTCRADQEKIQLRIAAKFRIMQRQQGRSIRDIFVAFDEDGGGTIDHEELRDGFDMLGIELNDQQFKRMLSVWDESGDGEIDFDEFTEMFQRTQLMLDVDGRRKLISFDAFEEVAPGGGPNGLPLGVASEEKKLRLAQREYERNERRRLRAEAEEARLRKLLGNKYKPTALNVARPRKIKWTLDRSCWAPRKLETDSNDYFDTDDIFRQACLADFRHAHRIIKLIKKNSEFIKVQDFLASQYRKLLGCYRMWCASDAQFGPFQMTNFAFKEFATSSTGICDNKIIKSRDLDNVFATVNAVVKSGSKVERKNKEKKTDNTSKSIVRYEFLESIVRLSLRRFKELDPLDAIRRIVEEFILPTCKPEWNLDDFRRNHLYLEGVHNILSDERFAVKLRNLYDEGVKRAKMNDRNIKLLNLKGFIEIMCFPIEDEEEKKNKEKKALELLEEKQKELETLGKDKDVRITIDASLLQHSSEIIIDEEVATVAFAQSQMTTVDEEDRSQSDSRRDSSDFATYVEYLEAIVRVALSTMKGLEVEMMTTPQKLERFLCTVLFPRVGLPEHMYGTEGGAGGSSKSDDETEGQKAEGKSEEEEEAGGKKKKKKKKGKKRSGSKKKSKKKKK